MERLQELINQLKEQYERRVDPAQMLLTTRQLEAELTLLSAQVAPSRVSAKVAVMMPTSMKMYAGQTAPVAQEVNAAPIPVMRSTPEQGTDPRNGNGRNVLVPTPVSRELNDVIGSTGSSLNDKLKAEVLDLASTLNDGPVRDLKKAIGVNDRYVFISQLFRGDEVMYERSIKTINGFRILPEAEYWMERELKVKLGWDETRDVTRQFYQLVRRRFS